MFPHKPIIGALSFAFASAVQAQTAAKPQQLEAVVITANPLGSDLFDMVPPVSVLTGRDLDLRRGSTIGETLDGIPGVSTSYFGPNVGRPIIRGLDADRIRVMSNGLGVLDASGLSQDHGVPVDPLIVERFEVVRGAAALLYGGNAVGGLVNAIDNRIPSEARRGVSGRFEARAGSGDGERSGAALLEAGNGLLALHADGYWRKSADLKIPDFARSARLRALDPQPEEPRDRLPNSSNHGDGGALGASLTFGERGFAGLSYAAYNQNYGTVAEPDVRIQMRNARWDLAGELRQIDGFITGVKFKAGYTDYEHQEIAGGVPETQFINKGHEIRVEATHRPFGPLAGAFGVQLADFDFSALGEEAFVPKTGNKSVAFFVFEEMTLGALKLNVGGRIERARVESEGGGPDDPSTGLPRFGAARERRFSAKSAVFGGQYSLTPSVAVSANLSHTERAPSYYELFANGNHAATGLYEVGDPNLSLEKANGIDLQLKVRSEAFSGSIGAYYNRFRNYVALFNSGNTRSPEGELNPAEDPANPGLTLDGGDILPESVVRPVRAEFYGFEAQGKLRLLEGSGGRLDGDLRADYVHANDSDTGQPLPRISPLRVGGGLNWTVGPWEARFDVTHALRQKRTAENELPTDAYTLVGAAVSYRLKLQSATLEAFLKAANLLDREARLHTSYLKDIAPLGGRSLVAGIRASF
jgi:iron complex outermembrane receptor protein